MSSVGLRQVGSKFAWKAEDLAQFSDDGAVLKGAVCADEGDVVKALENVPGNVIPVGPGEINVKVGGIRPVEVDEPFEVQIQFDGAVN